ncbi:MAG: GyrI-like domain-containing protein [Bacteroidia bacterium]
MNPEIKILAEKQLVGKKITTSFSKNNTVELWKNFMPRRKEIKNNIGEELYSMQIYPPMFYANFNVNNTFEKWATIEVTDFNDVPVEMETFVLVGGLYAAFQYKGLNTDTKIFENIFSSWLPNSPYAIDDRPHFEIMVEKYKNNDPNSEEEIWIPIKNKV